MYRDVTIEELDKFMQKSRAAFHSYRKLSLKQRADFMREIAHQLQVSEAELIVIAARETNLTEARLRGELKRTIFQLTSYAAACEKGDWLDIRIDTGIADKTPPKPDLRKMLIPLGPVAVFGAANFPFAYSTAGGDTACALAAGCPVIVKAHPAHAGTGEKVAEAIHKAIKINHLPDGVFTHIHGVSFSVGKALVEHPLVKAVGFTGSLAGGKQLFDWANQRKEPIPVFAEMSSTNPVFLLPEKLKNEPEAIANMYADSITLGVGQFCTNPGLIIGIESPELDDFEKILASKIEKSVPETMLHQGISKNYFEKRADTLAQPEVRIIAVSEISAKENLAVASIAETKAENFIKNPILHKEVFGPFSLIIKCTDISQMAEVALHIGGQLTATIMATDDDIMSYPELIEDIKNLCGRFILNGVPTGVEVCLSMQHGGPFPATTDSRFTAVGADGIRRFSRPIAFQNWSNDLLPDELKNENPLGIWRTVNNELTKESV
ncbi:MAG: aldehyde dehydrogenase (NADP(+)) [Chitinophagaceae bacterium]|jgi:alpha-ketoglutaric semialdehyde dehydrogenase|nr:aldehyde dehydrogenase (NADP(+)) [Chitinophagaceae bacterium]HRN47066.1 aldehyde dehydrogenase (NADP(+)) [Niabella sp.]